jgi:hypothetical protein
VEADPTIVDETISNMTLNREDAKKIVVEMFAEQR